MNEILLYYVDKKDCFSRLLIEYTRRSPEKAFILSCPTVQRLLKDENIDLNNIMVSVKKEKSGNDNVASKTSAAAPYKPILPVRSSSTDEIQVIAIKTSASPSSCILAKGLFDPRNVKK